MSRLFLLAYTCSGFAGLVYQVCWTRLLTLYIGHGTAAASVVVAAFLGGLAVGAAGGGTIAPRLTQRQSLTTYALLELGVAAAALIFPLELRAFVPALAATYNNGEASVLFASIRLLVCVLTVFAPAVLLGATFPMAVTLVLYGCGKSRRFERCTVCTQHYRGGRWSAVGRFRLSAAAWYVRHNVGWCCRKRDRGRTLARANAGR